MGEVAAAKADSYNPHIVGQAIIDVQSTLEEIKLNIPDEMSFLSLFECEPFLLDEKIPYYYNQAIYKFRNDNAEVFIVSISPSFGEIRIEVSIEGTNEPISVLELKNIESLEILSDKKYESKLQITSANSIMRINFKPRFKIYMSQFYE